jgi:hypothetical protein
MCPIKLWASIVTRILTYEGSNTNSPVSLARHSNKTISITSEMVANLLKDGVVAIGETKLGIQCHEIGTHSIRSGFLMLIGRWSSLAFLKYIRKQVQEFSFSILKNDRSPIIQTHQHHPLNGDKRFNCWRLVFVADGIKLMEGASEPKGRGRGWN